MKRKKEKKRMRGQENGRSRGMSTADAAGSGSSRVAGIPEEEGRRFREKEKKTMSKNRPSRSKQKFELRRKVNYFLGDRIYAQFSKPESEKRGEKPDGESDGGGEKETASRKGKENR